VPRVFSDSAVLHWHEKRVRVGCPYSNRPEERLRVSVEYTQFVFYVVSLSAFYFIFVK